MLRLWLPCVLIALSPLSLAEGIITTLPTPIYDAPSAKARAKVILSGGHPLRQISRVHGWRKVRNFANEEGWVAETDIRDSWHAVVTTERADIRVDPSDTADLVFHARKGVVLEVLARAHGGWLQVLHVDGESGYVRRGDLWLNR
jgi:SH3-like domain-containing protein